MILAPTTSEALQQRAAELAGCTFQDIAERVQLPCPTHLTYAKGWLGQCLEILLGSTAGSQPIPDFEQLGIELKTIPISPELIPLESTYVCSAPLPFRDTVWQTSRVYHKLRCVLWVPIVTVPGQPFQKRRLGQAFLWTPTAEQGHYLQTDWEELTEYLTLGHLSGLSARLGTYLHIRPKAMTSQVRVVTTDHQGDALETIPKGFYLRTALTEQILKNQYAGYSKKQR